LHHPHNENVGSQQVCEVCQLGYPAGECFSPEACPCGLGVIHTRLDCHVDCSRCDKALPHHEPMACGYQCQVCGAYTHIGMNCSLTKCRRGGRPLYYDCPVKCLRSDCNKRGKCDKHCSICGQDSHIYNCPAKPRPDSQGTWTCTICNSQFRTATRCKCDYQSLEKREMEFWGKRGKPRQRLTVVFCTWHLCLERGIRLVVPFFASSFIML
jgi:hypothetical protein